MLRAARTIEAKYAQLGYTQACVADYTLSDENVLHFTIQEITISQIVITGNSTTPEATIRNALTFQVGDVYNNNALQQSLRKLEVLGLFT